LACFDDAFWAKLLPRRLVRMATTANEHAEPSRPLQVTSWIVTAVIGFLSIQPVVNMLSPDQIMNTSYDPLNLVNTYGAFGSVGKERYNIVFEGTSDPTPDSTASWKAYPYKGLPVDTNRRPPQVAPYQLRLDWQMWFAAMSSPDEYPWTLTLISKLLHNDPRTISLFAGNPFPGNPPKYIRAVLYRYTFARPGDHAYWHRQRLGDWLPAMSAGDPRLNPPTGN
ncbi:MAG TPA: lipase maturation factor family protein, partial [Puia sp.]|nr:lipase maturation factor family protein [Puia sp.]